MDNDENAKTVVKVEGLDKDFVVPHERRNSLKERALNIFRPTDHETFHALKDINFEVRKGEFFGIVGRNGSGKSTLLKLMAGIYQPTAGSVHIEGTLTPFIELGIGFNPELSGRENVYLNGAILGLTRKEIDAKYDEIVQFSELEKFMDTKLKNYSSGMQVRLAFSIAMQAHNDILLIDEVLAVGDANFQRKCYKIFREIKKSDKTVIFVTHDMGSVVEFCDRALMIKDSQLIAIGDPREIAQRYELANSTDEATAASNKLERPKNPRVHIDEFKLTNNGKPSDQFGIDDDIVGHVTISVKSSVGIQLNFFLIDDKGEYLAGINSTRQVSDYAPKKGIHKLRCNIDAGQLKKGTYRVGVAIYTTDDIPELIDIIDRGYSDEVPEMTIKESSGYQDGRFYIKGIWSKR